MPLGDAAQAPQLLQVLASCATLAIPPKTSISRRKLIAATSDHSLYLLPELIAGQSVRPGRADCSRMLLPSCKMPCSMQSCVMPKIWLAGQAPLTGGRRSADAAQLISSRTRYKARPRQQHPMTSCKMHVPSDSFGGQSPEKRASRALINFFTFISVKCAIVMLKVFS